MKAPRSQFAVRQTRPQDFSAIREMSREVYPLAPPWTPQQLGSHLRLFPQGQFVAADPVSQSLVGMAASLIVAWQDYDARADWITRTANGTFLNHDPKRGRTLYAAELMVRPSLRGRGAGTLLHVARQELLQRLNLPHIRGGSRLQNYSLHAGNMTAEEYVSKVSRGELNDPTLSFQIRDGFRVLGVVPNYIQDDPECLGYAAMVEWVNPSYLAETTTPD